MFVNNISILTTEVFQVNPIPQIQNIKVDYQVLSNTYYRQQVMIHSLVVLTSNIGQHNNVMLFIVLLLSKVECPESSVLWQICLCPYFAQ